MKNKILTWNDPKIISLLVESLKNNNICAGSTDTVLGLLGNTTQESMEKLNDIKLRSLKSYIILINSIEKLPIFINPIVDNLRLQKFLKKIWPGPITVIFKSNKDVMSKFKTMDDTIAIRIPNHPGLLQLLTFFEGLFSTSANLSGNKVPEFFNELDERIKSLVEYIVLDTTNENYRYPIVPSTILDCTKDKLRLVREGVISINTIEKIYGQEIEREKGD